MDMISTSRYAEIPALLQELADEQSIRGDVFALDKHASPDRRSARDALPTLPFGQAQGSTSTSNSILRPGCNVGDIVHIVSSRLHAGLSGQVYEIRDTDETILIKFHDTDASSDTDGFQRMTWGSFKTKQIAHSATTGAEQPGGVARTSSGDNAGGSGLSVRPPGPNAVAHGTAGPPHAAPTDHGVAAKFRVRKFSGTTLPPPPPLNTGLRKGRRPSGDDVPRGGSGAGSTEISGRRSPSASAQSTSSTSLSVAPVGVRKGNSFGKKKPAPPPAPESPPPANAVRAARAVRSPDVPPVPPVPPMRQLSADLSSPRPVPKPRPRTQSTSSLPPYDGVSGTTSPPPPDVDALIMGVPPFGADFDMPPPPPPEEVVEAFNVAMLPPPMFFGGDGAEEESSTDPPWLEGVPAFLPPPPILDDDGGDAPGLAEWSKQPARALDHAQPTPPPRTAVSALPSVSPPTESPPVRQRTPHHAPSTDSTSGHGAANHCSNDGSPASHSSMVTEASVVRRQKSTKPSPSSLAHVSHAVTLGAAPGGGTPAPPGPWEEDLYMAPETAMEQAPEDLYMAPETAMEAVPPPHTAAFWDRPADDDVYMAPETLEGLGLAGLCTESAGNRTSIMSTFTDDDDSDESWEAERTITSADAVDATDDDSEEVAVVRCVARHDALQHCVYMRTPLPMGVAALGCILVGNVANRHLFAACGLRAIIRYGCMTIRLCVVCDYVLVLCLQMASTKSRTRSQRGRSLVRRLRNAVNEVVHSAPTVSCNDDHILNDTIPWTQSCW